MLNVENEKLMQVWNYTLLTCLLKKLMLYTKKDIITHMNNENTAKTIPQRSNILLPQENNNNNGKR